MTILAAMQSAAVRLIKQKPQVFFGSSNGFEQEICDLVNEVATEICKYHDWQALIKINNIDSDGVVEVYDLPADYDRQLLYTNIQDLSSYLWSYTHIADINEFISQKNMSFAYTPGIWTMYGNQLHFLPAPQLGQSASFPYISLNYAVDQSGTGKSAFSEDTDEFIIRGGERLLTLGLIWRWRENKKLDYTGDQENFTQAITQLAARDKGSNVFRQHSSRASLRNANFAYPWLLGY